MKLLNPLNVLIKLRRISKTKKPKKIREIRTKINFALILEFFFVFNTELPNFNLII